LRLFHVKARATQFLCFIGSKVWKIWDYFLTEPKFIGHGGDARQWKSGWHFAWFHIKFFGIVFGVYGLWIFAFVNFFESYNYNAVWGIIFVFLSICFLGMAIESDKKGTKHH